MEQTSPVIIPWTTTQTWTFRFLFLFFILLILTEPNAGAPMLQPFYQYYIQPVHWAITWLAANVLHLPERINTFTNGSGDTTYDYLVVFSVAVLSLIGTIIWSVIKRGPCNYYKLYYWLTVMLRFYVGITMIAYGGVKIIKLQFPAPGLYRLLEPYGDSSPMGLAWTFMGYSKGYNYFTGLAELSCGLLLLFRKTTTLGAVIALTVAANIMAINYCFDVPVKIISTMLVVMTLFILGRDFSRFINFFFLNQTVQPAVLTPMRFKKRWKNITLITLKYLLITYVIVITAYACIKGMTLYGERAPKPPLYGIYNAETFIRGHDTIAPLITDGTRWRRLVISGQNYAQVYFMNDSTLNYIFKIDTSAKKVFLYNYSDSAQKYVLKYIKSDPGVLKLEGKLLSDTVQITLRRFDEKKFRLNSRGFHWVNEYPFNR
ncbi:hypothetical protein HH214_17035 [Mucilaginibacter robiniae]|uniref:DoxX family protein n=1 Tax=Mucilaginibacter robiniae TaxID=2728022 RepID=A0A7L5E2V1_9SPHI|nr:hypothetical protein [Mucilaginibacter robiniae]QJD97455.1 hypothetical protein HH214_17035 [Mucilaginibacter robiniae]